MIALIAAIARNGCIGIEGKLPWHIPEDFEHFKRHTMGKVVLMGRRTWDSLPPKFRPLPNRTNVVITKRVQDPFSGAEVYGSINDALAAHVNEDIFVIGGASIYEQTIARADRLIITHVERVVGGDAFFPPIDPMRWQEISHEAHSEFSFATYEKVKQRILSSTF